MTREEKRQRRRETLLMALCIFIIAVWVAALLCTCADAAYDAAEAETAKTWLAGIGGVTMSWVLYRAIVWLDTPRRSRGRAGKQRNGMPAQPAADAGRKSEAGVRQHTCFGRENNLKRFKKGILSRLF